CSPKVRPDDVNPQLFAMDLRQQPAIGGLDGADPLETYIVPGVDHDAGPQVVRSALRRRLQLVVAAPHRKYAARLLRLHGSNKQSWTDSRLTYTVRAHAASMAHLAVRARGDDPCLLLAGWRPSTRGQHLERGVISCDRPELLVAGVGADTL